MEWLQKLIGKSLERVIQTVKSYPMVILSGFGFTMVIIVRIYLDWPDQEVYNFLFNCLHLSFVTSGAFGLFATVFSKSRLNSKTAVRMANLLIVIVFFFTLILLYNFGGIASDRLDGRLLYVSKLSAARVTSAVVVSLLGFIYLMGTKGKDFDLSKPLMMFQKALLIALLYALVMGAGLSLIAGAVEGLLYEDMSNKVYMYLTALSGFVGFTFFVGYFPKVIDGKVDAEQEMLQQQAKFFQVLCKYILVPIVLSLSVVLLIWIGKILITKDWPEFYTLSGIIFSYAIGGIWLHLMVTDYNAKGVGFYRRIYSIIGILILVFGLRGWQLELGMWGLKIDTYYFALLWIVSMMSMLAMVKLAKKSHLVILSLLIVAFVISVLPIVGAQQLSFNIQVKQLENLLIEQGLLIENLIIPGNDDITEEVKIKITDGILYLVRDERQGPEWLNEKLREREFFKETLGFERTYPSVKSDHIESQHRLGEFIRLKSQVMAIDEDDWVFVLSQSIRYDSGEVGIDFTSDKGNYTIYWQSGGRTESPRLKIIRDDLLILEGNLMDYFDQMEESENNEPILIMTGDGIEVIIIFNYIEKSVDPKNDQLYYYSEVNSIFIKEL